MSTSERAEREGGKGGGREGEKRRRREAGRRRVGVEITSPARRIDKCDLSAVGTAETLEVQCTPPPRRTHTRRAQQGGRCFDLPRPPRRAKFPRFASRFVSPRDEPRSRSDGVRARGSCLTRTHNPRSGRDVWLHERHQGGRHGRASSVGGKDGAHAERAAHGRHGDVRRLEVGARKVEGARQVRGVMYAPFRQRTTGNDRSARPSRERRTTRGRRTRSIFWHDG